MDRLDTLYALDDHALTGRLATLVVQRLTEQVQHAQPGQCLRVDELPEDVIEQACYALNHTVGQAADVVILTDDDHADAPSTPLRRVSAGRAIELRNAEQRPLLVFIPVDLRSGSADSLGANTFTVVEGVRRKALYEGLCSELQAELMDLDPSLGRSAVQLVESLRLPPGDHILRYYLTVLRNDVRPEAVGGALYQLGLLPDFDLFSRPSRVNVRLKQNQDAIATLTDNRVLPFIRIRRLKVDDETIKEGLFRLLQRHDDWLRRLASDPAWRHLSFDHWNLRDPANEKIKIYLDTLGNLKPRPDGVKQFEIPVGKSAKLKVGWETTPLVTELPHLKAFRVELVDSADDVVVLETNALAPKRTQRRQSHTWDIKYDEDLTGLYYIRVRAFDADGNVINEESPETLRNPEEPEGLHINESAERFWIKDAPETGETPVVKNQAVTSVREAWVLEALAADKRGGDPPWESSARAAAPVVTAETVSVDLGFSERLGPRYTVSVTPRLYQLERTILGQPNHAGRWRLSLVAEEQAGVPLPAAPVVPPRFLAARRVLFEAITREAEQGRGGGFVAATHLLLQANLIQDYATAYLAWLASAEHQNSMAEVLDCDVVEVTLSVREGRLETALLLAPTHPLLMLWQLRYAQLCAQWLEPTGKLYDDMRVFLRRGLLPLHLPPLLAHQGEFLAQAHILDAHWPLYLPTALARQASVRQALGESLLVNRPASSRITALHGLLTDYLTRHPYITTLTLNVFNPGPADWLAGALVQLQHPLSEWRHLRYVIRLFADSLEATGGEELFALLNPAHQVAEGAEEFAEGSKNSLFPKLRLARHARDEFLQNPGAYQAHLSLFLEPFPSATELSPALEVGRSNYVQNLVIEPTLQYTQSTPGDYRWQRQLRLQRETPTDALIEMLDAYTRLQVAVTPGAAEGEVPTLSLTLRPRDKNLIYQLHEASDWVLTLDQNLGIEYFDSVTDDEERPIYLLAFTPPFLGNAEGRLLLTTRADHEISEVMRRVLNQMSAPPSVEQARLFLNMLRSLSGELALRLLGQRHAEAELTGLILARLYLEQARALRDHALIPLDAHLDLMRDREFGGGMRSDLLLVYPDAAQRVLKMRLVEVKYRTDALGLGASDDLEAKVAHQLANTEQRLRERFDPAEERVDRPLRHRELMTLLEFYLKRSRRYGLMTEESLTRAWELVYSLDQGYTLEFSRVGLIFNPALLTDYWHTANGVDLFWVGGPSIARFVSTATAAFATRQRLDDTGLDSTQTVMSQYLTTGRLLPSEPERPGPSATNSPLGSQDGRATPGQAPADDAPDDELASLVSMTENGGAVMGSADEVSLAEEVEALPRVEVEASPVPTPSLIPPPCDVLLGDNAHTPQFGLLGKAGPRTIGLDLNGCNTISLFGVQGGGKSYTLGSVVEMAIKPIPHLNLLPHPLAAVIFHYDKSQRYAPEFVSMIHPNQRPSEVQRLRDEYGADPAGLDDVILLTPPGKLAERRREFPQLDVRPLLLSARELGISDWKFLMGALGNQALYLRQLNDVLRSLRTRGVITLEGLRQAIDGSQMKQRDLAQQRLALAEQFIHDGPALSELLRPGRLLIIDLRDELIEKDEALGLFVSMLNIFASARDSEGQEYNKLIVFDEAHKYMDDPELTGSVVETVRQMRHEGVTVLFASQNPPSLAEDIVQLSSMLVLHRFDSPAWLRYLQKFVAATNELTTEQLSHLRQGEAYVWSRLATDRAFTERPIKVQCRPRATLHGGGTKTAV